MAKHIHDLLETHPFFEGMDRATLELIGGCGKNVRFDEGQYVSRAGDEAKEFYAIRHGRVAVQISAPGRGAITIQTLQDGDIFGWSWLFPPYRWMFDARALELTRAVHFDGACLRTKCEADPATGYDLMKRFAGVFARRIEATRLQLLDIYGTSPST
jgi:CRP-like cAMP-binding protein